MNLPALGDRLSYHLFQFGERAALRHSDLCGQLLHAGLGSHPDNVVHIHIVTEKAFLVAVCIDDTRKSGMRMAEEIDERTVLTKFIRIVRIICRGFVVSQNKYDAVTDFLTQSLAAVLISK